MRNKSTFAAVVLGLLLTAACGIAQPSKALIEKAKTEITNRDYDKAVSYLKIVLGDEPDNDEAYAQRARAYYLSKNSSAALDDANAALKINPHNVTALNLRGLIKKDAKQLDEALADFSAAIAADPAFVKPYLNRAAIYLARGEYDKTIADETRALAMEPDKLLALFGRGVPQNEETALTWFKKAAAQGNQDAMDVPKKLGK